MSTHKRFCFNYAITGTNDKGQRFRIDTVMVMAIAYFYADGTARTTDIDRVIDKAGQDITQWVPFLEYNSPGNCGDWMKELEQAAEMQAKRLFEETI